MTVFKLLSLAWKALLRNKIRTSLTMLGIIIGVAAVITMVSIGEGSKQSIRNQLSSMGSNMITIQPFNNTPFGGGARIGPRELQTLKVKDAIAIKKLSSYITNVSPGVSTNGQVINAALNWPTSMQGVSPAYLDIRVWKLQSGISFTDDDVSSAEKVCVLGQTVVDNIFNSGENPLGKIIRFNKIPIKVIGILEKKGVNTFGQDQDDIILAPYTTVQKRIMAITYIQTIYAAATDEKSSDTASKEISIILRSNHQLKFAEDNDFRVRTQAELISTMSSTSQLLTVLLTAIAAISLLVGGIGIMNIMYVSVTERTKEIGLRMAIGARGIDILLQFLTEAILISITGAVIGVILGITSAQLVTAFLSWPTLVSQSSVILSFLVCSVTGVFFGYYPALKASKLDPIEALRYE